MRPKVLILFSGGLDSILAAKILQNQNVEIKTLGFKSYFFNVEKAKEIAKDLKIKFKEINFSEEHLKMVKFPKYGYGSSMNPCIDCHTLMLKFAKKIMQKEKFDLVATGEILGERPMSQNKKALELIEKESSLSGFLLRPLSAKLLKPTIAENKGLINRKRLLDISGRSRKRQLTLAKKFKIKNFLSPAGGCLLTDLAFGRRLKELFEIHPECEGNDIELLKLGRHFWIDQIGARFARALSSFGPHLLTKMWGRIGVMRLLQSHTFRRKVWSESVFLNTFRYDKLLNFCPVFYTAPYLSCVKMSNHKTDTKQNVELTRKFKIKIVIGRNHQENLKIKKLARKNDILIELKRYPGPTTLIRDYEKNKTDILSSDRPSFLLALGKAKELTKYYSLKARKRKDVEFKITKA